MLNGCGRQQISANIGIVSWYLVGLPGGALLCFFLELELVRLTTLVLLKYTLRDADQLWLLVWNRLDYGWALRLAWF